MGSTFSPDSALLVTTDASMPRLDPERATAGTWTEGATSRVWTITDANHPRQLATLPNTTAMVVVFADRRRVVATMSRGDLTERPRLVLWDLTDPAVPRQTGYVDIAMSRQPKSATFAHHDRILYVGDTTGEVTAWEVGTSGPPQKLVAVKGTGGQIDHLTSSADDHTLISSDTAGQLTVWDISTSQVPRNPVHLSNRESRLTDLSFGTDNTTVSGACLGAAVNRACVVRWLLDADRSARAACQSVGPSHITKLEWEKYLSGAPYRPPCA
jgi:WD40 repeat protein